MPGLFKRVFMESKMPLNYRLFWSFAFMLAAYVIVILLVFIAFIISPPSINRPTFKVLVFSSLAMAAALPWLRYKKLYLDLAGLRYVLVVWFSVWFSVMVLLLQPIERIKEESIYTPIAEQLLPPNAVLIPGKITYTPGIFAKNGPSVKYWYSSQNPQADYKKVRDFYIGYPNQYGWKVSSDINDHLSGAYLLKDGVLREISINLEKDPNYPIQVSIIFTQPLK